MRRERYVGPWLAEAVDARAGPWTSTGIFLTARNADPACGPCTEV